MEFKKLLLTLFSFAFITQSTAFADGRIERHQFESIILADAGRPSNRSLSVYLPEGYDTSGMAYPVSYLIHGGSVRNNPIDYTDEVWFVYGFNSLFDEIPKPLIMVMPSMGNNSRIIGIEESYFLNEIVPFIDSNYRTIPSREWRGILGYSRGGVDSLYIALLYPELFSIVGAVSAGVFSRYPTIPQLLEEHDQEAYPIQFWLAYGQNEEMGITAHNRDIVKALEELGIPHVYVEDPGIHADLVRTDKDSRGWKCIKYISEIIGGSVTSIDIYSDCTKTWGRIKRD